MILLLILLAILLPGLKLGGVIAWSWFLVLAPLWVLAVGFVVFTLMAGIAGVVAALMGVRR